MPLPISANPKCCVTPANQAFSPIWKDFAFGFYTIQMGLVLGDPLGVRDLNGGLSDQGSCVYFVIALVGYSE